VLEARKAEFAKLLPSHLSAEKLLKVAINCIAKTPELQACSIESVLRCVYASAELGLELGGVMGYAYMLPFDGVATFVIGYRGLLKLVTNSGEVSSVRAVVVRKKDIFRYSEGLSQRVLHEPFLDGDAGELVRVYSVATMKDGTKTAEFMTRAQVDAIKARSRIGAKNKGPWLTDYEEMAKKTVVRRHSKYLPMSDEVREMLGKDEDVIDGEIAARDGVPAATETAEKKSRRRLGIVDVPSEEPAPELPASVAAAAQGDLTEQLKQSLEQKP
jgi:recombination protein RecT